MAAVLDFAGKFGLVLKAFNLSRGRLAQAVGIDKSVVSRWASGATVPTDHSLSLLTQAVARHKADFSRADWDLDGDAFAVRLGLESATPAPVQPRDRPSIAVLALQNLGGSADDEYFADGIAEDIITALSRFRSLFVIARNSSFTYKGRTVDVREIGRELGVRYVLEGSVRRAGGRVRVTAQLIDTDRGGHVWADKYDGPVADVFELQDRITEAVVGVLEPAIERAEMERMRRKRPTDLDAYDWFLRALANSAGFTRDSTAALLSNSLKAIELDPGFAPAYALAARSYVQRATQGWISYDDKAAEVLDLIERGLRADRQDAMMLGTAGHVIAGFTHDIGKAVAHIDEALAINPNYAHAYLQSGIVRARVGDTETAIEHLERARRLSPRDPRSCAIFKALAEAHHLASDTEAAYAWALRSVQHNANFGPGWSSLAAAASATGREEEAANAAERLLVLQPDFSVGWYSRRYPEGAQQSYRPIFDGLRRAGLPD